MRIGLALFAAISLSAAALPATANPASNKEVVKRPFAAFNEGDVEAINRIFTSDGPSHAPNGKVSQQGGPFTELKDDCLTDHQPQSRNLSCSCLR
jgi:hypothetical protein